MVEEVFEKCSGETEFPILDFSRQAKLRLAERIRLPKKPEPGGSKEGDWVYADSTPGAQTEILV
jgi:hypothetical protein